MVLGQYAPTEEEHSQVTASPLRASIDQLTGLPPALVITGEADVLHDEGEAYAAKLRRAGVPVTAVRYLGIVHRPAPNSSNSAITRLTDIPGQYS
jgi:acetyl esterase